MREPKLHAPNYERELKRKINIVYTALIFCETIRMSIIEHVGNEFRLELFRFPLKTQ